MNALIPADMYVQVLDLARGRASIDDLLPLVGALTLLQTAQAFPAPLEALGVKTPPQLAERLDALTLDLSTVEALLAPLLKGRTPHINLGLDGRAFPAELVGRMSKLIGVSVSRVALRDPGAAGLQAVGQAFTQLLDDGKFTRFDEHTSPASLADLTANLLDVHPGMQILDPAAGHARMLLSIATRLRQQGADPNSVRYVGQEVNAAATTVAACHLLLNGVANFTLYLGSALTHPATPTGAFDRVIGDPPFALSVAHKERDWALDPRFSASKGLPRTADWLFVQHGLAALKPGGRAVFTTTHGPLFRGGAERDIREFYAAAGWLNAVISLPSALYTGTSVPVVITVFDRPRSGSDRNHEMLMVDAAGQGVRKGRQNMLPRLVIDRLAHLVETRTEDADPRIHQVVTLSRLQENDHAWQPNQYLPRQASEGRNLTQIRTDLQRAVKGAEEAHQRLGQALQALDLSPSPSKSSKRKTKETT